MEAPERRILAAFLLAHLGRNQFRFSSWRKMIDNGMFTMIVAAGPPMRQVLEMFRYSVEIWKP
ncbi:hypothetical protein [Bradyrhizobium sp. SYSU BS000235]|uniref:hypothetical protein n=1 Tax=Bradyrhizobium sp. SYSU BS000235 TaxID=3411332 RepID=UPI003C788C17